MTRRSPSTEGRRSPPASRGPYRALLLASVLGPALLFGAMAWWSWQRVERETERSIARSVDLLHEHAAKLLQADELALSRIDDRVDAAWPEIARRERELHLFLRALSGQVEEIEAAFVADADGELQATSSRYPAPARTEPVPTAANVHDRWYFEEARRRDGVIVDGPFVGRVTGKPIFNVVRRLSSPDGSFRGIAAISVSPRYLTDFWKGVVAPGDTVSLVRDDGVVLARYPELPASAGQAPRRYSETTLKRMRATDAGQLQAVSRFDGVDRTLGFRKLPGQPIRVVYAVDRRNVLREWYPTAVAFGALAAAACAALLLTALAVIRRGRGEADALARAEAAAKALQESEDRARALYGKTPAPMHACDIDGRIVAVSERWLELLGYERQEVIGRKVTEFMTRETAAEVDAIGWREILDRGDVRDVPRKYMRKTGEVLDVLVSARVERDGEGRFLRALGVLVDVTEQKRMAAALRQAQKMEAVGQMTGGVAHDFNNLLTVIFGNLEMIVRGAERPQLVRQLAENALRAAQRGGKLTQQLLAFARRQMLLPEVVDPNRLIREFMPLIRQAAGETVEVEVTLAGDVEPFCVDPTQFQSAILNLVVNARDAMPQGGRIAIETRNIVVSAGEAPLSVLGEGDYVLVAVADNGIGMSADVLEKVFEPFFTTKEVGQGSGLGLSMVYGFVQQSGGHVDIQSQPAAGTLVSLYLPRAAAPTEAPVPARMPEVQDSSPGCGSILLVEDNAEVSSVTRATLDGLGYDVEPAADATEALHILRSGRALDVLFTDIVMPGGMAGDQLAREALRLRPGIKVLLTSGYAEELAVGGGDPGGFARIAKPYRRAELAAKLRELLPGTRQEPI